ncbi:unnamed protein product [Malus baccata var. baccata]
MTTGYHAAPPLMVVVARVLPFLAAWHGMVAAESGGGVAVPVFLLDDLRVSTIIELKKKLGKEVLCL